MGLNRTPVRVLIPGTIPTLIPGTTTQGKGREGIGREGRVNLTLVCGVSSYPQIQTYGYLPALDLA